MTAVTYITRGQLGKPHSGQLKVSSVRADEKVKICQAFLAPILVCEKGGWFLAYPVWPKNCERYANPKSRSYCVEATPSSELIVSIAIDPWRTRTK